MPTPDRPGLCYKTCVMRNGILQSLQDTSMKLDYAIDTWTNPIVGHLYCYTHTYMGKMAALRWRSCNPVHVYEAEFLGTPLPSKVFDLNYLDYPLIKKPEEYNRIMRLEGGLVRAYQESIMVASIRLLERIK